MLIENDVEIETGAAISSASWLVPAVPVLCRLTYIYWFVCDAGVFFFQAEDGIRDPLWSRGLGDVYKRQPPVDAHV